MRITQSASHYLWYLHPNIYEMIANKKFLLLLSICIFIVKGWTTNLGIGRNSSLKGQYEIVLWMIANSEFEFPIVNEIIRHLVVLINQQKRKQA